MSSASSSNDRFLDIVLVGGDGTTHELLNGLYLSQSTPSKPHPKIRLAIVPGGTANALYSALYPAEWTQEVQSKVAQAKSSAELSPGVLEVMLQSVNTLASSLTSSDRKDQLTELPLMLNTLYTNHTEKTLISHLVTSHALHAAILHDADTPKMRAEHSGIDRFKIAAQLNATKWIDGVVTLHPNPLLDIMQYCPATKSFSPLSEKSIEMQGPFLYLNAMLTDRLESSFVPAPLSNCVPKGAVDIVMIRPGEKYKKMPREEGGKKFAEDWLGKISTGMYSGGTHVDLTYEEGDVVVEYFRCGGYEFKPEPRQGNEGDKGRLVCTDGYISLADRVVVRRWDGKDGDEGGIGEGPMVWR